MRFRCEEGSTVAIACRFGPGCLVGSALLPGLGGCVGSSGRCLHLPKKEVTLCQKVSGGILFAVFNVVGA